MKKTEEKNRRKKETTKGGRNLTNGRAMLAPTGQRGITLIALIITIIVMLILVAVTVTTVVNSGLFGKAGEAAQKWANAQEQENSLGDGTYVSDMVNQYTNGIGNSGGSSGGTITPEPEPEPLPVATAGVRVTENSSYPSGDKTATIPGGFTVSGVASENTIDGGLVIYLIPEGTTVDWTDDAAVATAKTTYDQFVWIPIEDINDMYMCQSEDGTKSCRITVQEVAGEDVAYCTTHSSDAMAGRLYDTAVNTDETFSYFDATLANQTYTADSGLREPALVTGSDGTSRDGSTTNLGYINGIIGTSYATADDFLAGLQNEYNEIVKSVYENKGFYVGRYETSNITKTDGTSIDVVAGVSPSVATTAIWYYMYAQQRDYATNNSLTVGSTMIQGAAYDQVMKFVNTDTYDVTTAGNVSHNFTDIYQTGGLNYSGTVAYNDVSKNIYDLEGNVSTYTLEADSEGRTVRGGNFEQSYDAAYRPGVVSNVGSLTQLYIK